MRLIKESTSSSSEGKQSLTRIVMQFPRVKSAFRIVRRVWKRYDTDGNGTLEFSELERCLDDLGASLTPEDSHAMFAEADLDGSQGLDFREFTVALTLGCVLQLFPSLSAYSHVDIEEPAAVPPSTPGARAVTNPLLVSAKPGAGRVRTKSVVRTKQMESVVEAMKLCVETFMLFDEAGEGVLHRDTVFRVLAASSKNARRHSGVGFGAASFLSLDRWEAMPWDRRGNVDFKEFCLHFFDWICPEGGTDVDEDDGSPERSGAGGMIELPQLRSPLPPGGSDDSLADDDVADARVITSDDVSPARSPARSFDHVVPTPPPGAPPPFEDDCT
jgi:hypothetical protein